MSDPLAPLLGSMTLADVLADLVALELREVYRRPNTAVRLSFPSDQVLVLDVQDGPVGCGLSYPVEGVIENQHRLRGAAANFASTIARRLCDLEKRRQA